MSARSKLLSFLQDPAQCAVALVGASGSGKQHLVRTLAEELGWHCRVLDRASGALQPAWLGGTSLCNNGPQRTLIAVCSSDLENHWQAIIARLTNGSKLVLIANDGEVLRKAKVPVI